MLADRDREADVGLAADRDDVVGLEARVGPHRQLARGPGGADPADRLGQEVGGAPDGVGPTLAQARHEHVAGAGRDREERVIAPDAGVPVVEGTLLGETVRLADRRVEIDREGSRAGSGTRCPACTAGSGFLGG